MEEPIVHKKQTYFPYNPDHDYNPFEKTKAHTKSVWCTFCFGTGYYRARAHNIKANMDPRITIKLCQHCKGRKRFWVTPGSETDKKSKQVVAGLWPNQNYKIHRK